MTSSFINWSNTHSTSNWSWGLPINYFPIHVALHIRSWQHYFKICSNPHITSNYVMTSSSIICSNPQITSNWSWNLPVTYIPVHVELQIWSWQHSITFDPIQRAPHIRSRHHHITCSIPHLYFELVVKVSLHNLPIHIALQIRSWQQMFTNVPIRVNVKLGQGIILYHMI
jgi:hypothetical protein